MACNFDTDIFGTLSRHSPSHHADADMSLCGQTDSEMDSNFAVDLDDNQPQLVRAFSINPEEDDDDDDDIIDDDDDTNRKMTSHAKSTYGGVKSFASGVAMSASGEFLVIDHRRKLGKVFNQMGYLKYSFGVGLLNDPWDVFVSESGKIVVSDSTGHLKVFSSKGKFLQSSELGCHLISPKGIAYHPFTKELLVCDPVSCCVYAHNPDGIVTDILTLNPPNNMTAPKYVHFDAVGNIYVVDPSAHQLHVFNAQKKHKFTYGKKGNQHGEMLRPGGVCTDRFGNVLIADTGNCRVHLLDGVTGEFKDYVLTWEDGLVDPQALTIDGEGHLVVTESSTAFVKVYMYEHLNCVESTTVESQQPELNNNNNL